MPVDFDDSDLNEALGEEAPPEIELQETLTEDDVEDQMSEAEARLEIASYYKLLLNQEMFDAEDQNAAALQVQTEMRDFARQRLAALLGVKMKNTGLSDTEVKILRVLADENVIEILMTLVSRLAKKPSLLGNARKQLEDVGTEAPAAAPAPAPRKVKAPSLRKVNTGRPATTQLARATATVRTPVQQTQPTRQPESLIPEGQVVEGPHVKGRRGKQKQIVKTIVDATGKEIEMNLTGQTPTPPEIAHLRKPPVDATQFNMISAAHASEALRTFDKKLRGGGD